MLSDALKGKAPLRRVFWVYGVGVSVAYSALGLFIDPLNVKSIVVYTVIGLAIGVVQCIMLWRCAPNSRSQPRHEPDAPRPSSSACSPSRCSCTCSTHIPRP